MQKTTSNSPCQGKDLQGERLENGSVGQVSGVFVENTDLLGRLREDIDVLDEEILHLLQKRAGVSKAVAAAKNGSVSFRPEREKEVLERLYSLNSKLKSESLDLSKSALSRGHIQAIWAEIFSCSRSLQRPLGVSFLGPVGTFSHFASREVFGQSSEFIPCVDFAEVFDRVYKHESDFGIVPIENSQQGSVGQCLDLFDTYPVKIIGEHYAQICQCLLSTETNLSEIEEIFSHPQALMQSSDWIKKHMPHARLTEMSSTAHAAHRAIYEKKTAVIGHEKLVQLYYSQSMDVACEKSANNTPANDVSNNHASTVIRACNSENIPLLHVLAKDIAKDKNNQTRFAIIASREDMEAELTRKYKKPKSSFTFSLPDKAGALSEILCLLEKASINLTKLESRPLYQRIKDDTWQYRFFADANANLWKDTELVKNIHKICHDFRILGVYESNV